MARSRLTEEDRQHGVQLGAQLGSARGAQGRSAQDLAQAARVSIDAVKRVESGRVPTPSFLIVAKIAAELGLSLDELHRNAVSR